jgi:hypothetical protein
MGPVDDWYLRWVGIPLAVLTWFGGALALFLFFWPIGVVALFFALLLTAVLLGRYAASKQAPIARRE